MKKVVEQKKVETEEEGGTNDDEEELEIIIGEISELIVELGGKPIDEDLVTPEDEKRPDDY